MQHPGERHQVLATGWRFGGAVPLPGPEDGIFADVVERWSDPQLDDSDWPVVTVPHTVTPLSWRGWEGSRWERVWIYRRDLAVAVQPGERLFLDFEAVLTTAIVSVNGVRLGEHRGGYLPFSFEVTGLLRGDGRDRLAVLVDARFNIDVPPNAPDMVPHSSIDFYQPGGIHRPVRLRAVPAVFVADLAVTHHDVLDPGRRRTTAAVTVDAARALEAAVLTLRLLDAHGVLVAESEQPPVAIAAGRSIVPLELTRLAAVRLWDVDDPVLYDLQVVLRAPGAPEHAAWRRTGYREARFEPGGFVLNGRRLFLTGVNRHEQLPFAGFAAPERVHRRDAQLLKTELLCRIVRCSHYPQSTAFLDACDELGLLVWEEPPGWHYLGDQPWQDAACADIEQMIARDRHRPSVVVWGARLNETPDHPALYARSEALVKALDPTRATSGALHGDYSRRAVFQHDVFAYDDYAVRRDERGRTRPALLEPVTDRPYLVTESVAARSSPTGHYHRDQPAVVQQHQALDHAQATNDARGDPRFTGLITWVAFDYPSPRGNRRRGLRTTGLADTFRFLKPGAAFTRSQIDPAVRPVLELAFGWDPEAGDPGAEAIVCANLDRLELFADGRHVATALPDRAAFPHLDHPPFLVDLTTVPRGAELRVDGYLGATPALVRRFSGDRGSDGLRVLADDSALRADGVDGTRVAIEVVDRFGNARTSSAVPAVLTPTGPVELIGDRRIPLDETGGVAAVWLRTIEGRAGTATVVAVAEGLGSDVATVDCLPDPAPTTPPDRQARTE